MSERRRPLEWLFGKTPAEAREPQATRPTKEMERADLLKIVDSIFDATSSAPIDPERTPVHLPEIDEEFTDQVEHPIADAQSDRKIDPNATLQETYLEAAKRDSDAKRDAENKRIDEAVRGIEQKMNLAGLESLLTILNEENFKTTEQLRQTNPTDVAARDALQKKCIGLVQAIKTLSLDIQKMKGGGK